MRIRRIGTDHPRQSARFAQSAFYASQKNGSVAEMSCRNEKIAPIQTENGRDRIQSANKEKNFCANTACCADEEKM